VIALVGQTVRDEIEHADGSTEVRTGGAPLFAAEVLADAGIDGHIITRGGDADLQDPLHGVGVPVVIGPAGDTFTSHLTLHAHGERDHAIAALGTPFLPEDVEGWAAPALEDAGTVVLGTQWRDDIPPETVRALARPDRRIVLDGQGLCRPGLGPVRPSGPWRPAWSAHVDVLKVSEEEADALLGGAEPHHLASAGIPIVVVTEGEAGEIVWTAASGDAIHVPADRVRGLADTVGAGDMFLALFAAGLDAGLDAIAAASDASAGVARALRRRVSPTR
jgi:sugar/nucleoside kinase (ribokinase family)